MDNASARTSTRGPWTIAAFLLVIGLAACGPGSGGDPAVTSVTVTPSSLQLGVGATASLEATVHASGNAVRTVTWTTSDDTVADVDAAGTVTGVAVGTATVTARSDHDPTRSASASVSVTTGSVASTAWTDQFGTAETESAGAVTIDAQGNVIAVGVTLGDLVGENAGSLDVFVRKYAPDGTVLWTDQFGTSARESAGAVTTDAAGNVLVTGGTEGDLAAPRVGNSDVYVRQYAPDGEVMWTIQFGTAQWDRGSSIAVDGDGNVIVAGNGITTQAVGALSFPGFVRTFAPVPGGTLDELWTYAAQTEVNDLTIDPAGNVVAVGTDYVMDFGREIYVVKLAPDGSEVWANLYGTGATPESRFGPRDPVPDTRRPTALWENLASAEDSALAVASDAAGNVYVTGYVGAFDTGTGLDDHTAFVLKLAPNGDETWAVLFGDEYHTYLNGIAVAPDGTVVAVGNTTAMYSAHTPAGTENLIRALDPDGTILWTDAFGETGRDSLGDVAIDADGAIVIVGGTLGDLAAENLGMSDAFVRKLVP